MMVHMKGNQRFTTVTNIEYTAGTGSTIDVPQSSVIIFANHRKKTWSTVLNPRRAKEFVVPSTLARSMVS